MKNCGECGLCCKLMGVSGLDKPAGKWCRQFSKTSGCAIYETRPDDCRARSSALCAVRPGQAARQPHQLQELAAPAFGIGATGGPRQRHA